MTTLTIRLSAVSDIKASFAETGRLALAGKAVEAVPTLNFASYDDLHRTLTPSRLDLLKILAGQGPPVAS